MCHYRLSPNFTTVTTFNVACIRNSWFYSICHCTRMPFYSCLLPCIALYSLFRLYFGYCKGIQPYWDVVLVSYYFVTLMLLFVSLTDETSNDILTYDCTNTQSLHWMNEWEYYCERQEESGGKERATKTQKDKFSACKTLTMIAFKPSSAIPQTAIQIIWKCY